MFFLTLSAYQDDRKSGPVFIPWSHATLTEVLNQISYSLMFGASALAFISFVFFEAWFGYLFFLSLWLAVFVLNLCIDWYLRKQGVDEMYVRQFMNRRERDIKQSLGESPDDREAREKTAEYAANMSDLQRRSKFNGERLELQKCIRESSLPWWMKLHLQKLEEQHNNFNTGLLTVSGSVTFDQIMTNLITALPPLGLLQIGPGRTWWSYMNEARGSKDKPLPPIHEVKPSDLFFHHILRTTFTSKLPDKLRPQGHMIMGPPGRGKTSILSKMILDDLNTGAAMVVMDSQESVINELLRIVPEDRLVYLDGSALEYPLALSPFEIGSTNRAQDEVKIVRSQELLVNTFADLGTEMTPQQQTLFAKLSRFLMDIPGASIVTAIRILQNGCEEYARYLPRLDQDDQEFIQLHLSNAKGTPPTYKPSRQGLEARLQSLTRIPAIKRMFGAPAGKVDVNQFIRDRKVVLVNTAQSTLGIDGASVFGRYILMQLVMEVLGRSETADPRKRVHLYLDEAQEYFSSGRIFERMLEQGRKRGLCPVFAFHDLRQLAKSSPDLPAAMRTFTAIKYVSGASPEDRNILARDMKVEPEALAPPAFQFAAYFRDMGNATVSAEKDVLKPHYCRSWDEVERIKHRMYDLYSYNPTPEPARERNHYDPDAPQRLD